MHMWMFQVDLQGLPAQSPGAIAKEPKDWRIHGLSKWICKAVSSMECELLPWCKALYCKELKDWDGSFELVEKLS